MASLAESVFRRIFFPSVNFTAHKRMKFMRYVRAGNLKTLDVACGGGSFSVVCAQKGNDVLGVDYDKSNIELANRYLDIFRPLAPRLSFRQFDIKHLETLGQTFDQVLCGEILEHIIDDDAIVGSIARITAPGATLLISVPNLHHKPMYKEEVSEVENGEHVRFGYSFEQLERLLGKHGFSVKAKDSCAGWATQWATSVEAFIALNLFKNRMPRWVSALLFVALYPVTYLDAVGKAEDLSIFVLAEKTGTDV